MKYKAFAKINLCLEIVGKLENNYHEISTIMQNISLYDEMNFEKLNSGIEINMDLDLESNLVYKAWKKLQEYTGRELGLKVEVDKKIPMGAGLAGGTANGAATLHALNSLYNLGLSLNELREIGVTIGADFPFMLTGGTAYCGGIGERITELSPFVGVKVLIVNPGFEISTREVYENSAIGKVQVDVKKLISAMEVRDFKLISENMKNIMENYVLSAYPEVESIKNELQQFTNCCVMSGSGPTVFGLFENDMDLDRAYSHFIAKYKNTFKCKTVGQ